MFVYGANVRHNPLMLKRYVLHDLRMAHAFGSGGLFAFSEMQSFGRNYDRLADRVFDPTRFATIGRHTELSLIIDREIWNIHDRKVTLLTHGSSKIPQPNRLLVMALVEHKHSVVPPFWWATTHWANGGYNGSRFKHMKRERIRLWNEQYNKTGSIFASVDESILWTGDINRVNAPKLLSDEVVLLEHKIDTLRKIEKPGGARFHLRNTRVLHGQRSDHSPLFARIQLEMP